MSVNEELAVKVTNLRHNLALAEDDFIGAAFDEARATLVESSPPKTRDQADRAMSRAVRAARGKLIDLYLEFALKRWEQHAVIFKQVTGLELRESKAVDDVTVKRFTRKEARQLIDEVVNTAGSKTAFVRLERSARMRARELFEQSVASGWSPQKLQRELVQSLGITRSRAETIVRTELQRVQQMVADRRRQKNRRLLKGVQYSAALDTLTCMICASVDGNVYYFDPVPKGGRSYDSKPVIPRHPRCRCEYIDVVKSWRELGVNMPRSKRRKYDGRPARRMRYADWFAKQPPEVQRAILGKARFELFRRGRNVRSFARDGKVVPVEQLLAEDDVAKPTRLLRRRTTRRAADVAESQAKRNGYADVSDRPNLLSGSAGAQAHVATEEEAREMARMVRAQAGDRGALTVGKVMRHAAVPGGETEVWVLWRLTYVDDDPTNVMSALDAMRSVARSPRPDIRARGIGPVKGMRSGSISVTNASGGEVTTQRPGAGDAVFTPDAVMSPPLSSHKISQLEAPKYAQWLPSGAVPLRIYGRVLVYRTRSGKELFRILP